MQPRPWFVPSGIPDGFVLFMTATWLLMLVTVDQGEYMLQGGSPTRVYALREPVQIEGNQPFGPGWVSWS